MESVIQYRAEGADQPCTHALTDLLRVEETGTLTASELTDHLTSTSVNTANAVMLPVLQALNVFLGHYAKSSPAIAMVGRSKSFSLSIEPLRSGLGAGLSALRRFFSTVQVTTSRILSF